MKGEGGNGIFDFRPNILFTTSFTPSTCIWENNEGGGGDGILKV